MAKANLIVLYVKDPLASVGFYRKVLGQEPRVTYQTFSSFELPGGFTLGLWAGLYGRAGADVVRPSRRVGFHGGE